MALIHTLHFGTFYRQSVEAKNYLGSTNTRGRTNTPINIPLMDKNDTGRQSHGLTIQFSVYDPPAAGELIVAFGSSSAGRPHHRIGERNQDLADVGAARQSRQAVGSTAPGSAIRGGGAGR